MICDQATTVLVHGFLLEASFLKNLFCSPCVVSGGGSSSFFADPFGVFLFFFVLVVCILDVSTSS